MSISNPHIYKVTVPQGLRGDLDWYPEPTSTAQRGASARPWRSSASCASWNSWKRPMQTAHGAGVVSLTPPVLVASGPGRGAPAE